jgi:hypothetical protein
MSVTLHAYRAGQEDAKMAFLGELYQKHIKGGLGPLMGGLFTANPLQAGLAGAVGQALDAPTGGSKILQSLGVAGGAAVANSLVHPIVSAIVDATASAVGIAPISRTGHLLIQAVKDIPTALAQTYAAGKGRSAATHVDQLLQAKGTRIP